MLLACASDAAAQASDWQAQLRARVTSGQLSAALELAERRLAEAPQDLEASGWRARLLAWTNRLPEAEAEYHRVLAAAPTDVDILAGLADVLAREQRFEEAQALLAQAQALAPSRADILTRQGHAWRALGRPEKAREAFRAALELEPANAEAKAGLESLLPALRHELRLGTDEDFFNYTSPAQAATISWLARWSAQWASSLAGNFYQRFGQQAGKFAGSATFRVSHHDALTAGGAAGHDQGIISKAEAFFEYGHGFRLSERGFVRGMETSYRQQWLWFQSARVLTLGENLLFYLPRGWTWSIGATGARSHFSGTIADWQPSGNTRLSIPLQRRLTANLFYAVGAENFAVVDQLGRFAAHTYGGGARVQLTWHQDLSFYGLHQSRTQARTQDSFGISYGIHF